MLLFPGVIQQLVTGQPITAASWEYQKRLRPASWRETLLEPQGAQIHCPVSRTSGTTLTVSVRSQDATEHLGRWGQVTKKLIQTQER